MKARKQPIHYYAKVTNRHTTMMEDLKPVVHHRPVVVRVASGESTKRRIIENVIWSAINIVLWGYCLYYASEIPLNLIRY